MSNSKFNMYEEQINNILNTNALLILLNEKDLITAAEFTEAKEKALKEFRNEYPDLFNK